jgi:uroporphyrinogen-III synthase
LASGIRAHNIECDELPLYRTASAIITPEFITSAQRNADQCIVTLCNPKAVQSVCEQLSRKGISLAALKTVSIGPVTSDALRRLGIEPTAEADDQSVKGIVDAVASIP